MKTTPEQARTAARLLVEAGALQFNDEVPFTYTSGLRGPVYVDCRRLIAFPAIRGALMDMMVEQLKDEPFDVIAGGETAGIPFAAFVAERMNLPMAYIRKKPKGHGRGARIEGIVNPGDRVLLVEDMATDGGSKVSFVEAVREAEGVCNHSAVPFFYGSFPGADERLAEHGITLHRLCTWADVLALCEDEKRLSPERIASIRAFLDNPDGWRAERGFA
ncbi:orotate phosphoribosyltransferase [Seohaeicola zhoushanensis]|uniref:Orotate phosphoribosyltransferase n=1 Tax=Seohaeicola zhoushanensis TaxID=1569283 RepID=A0A8J3GZF6_9RHOB|nr:orotate phosphoribosyltransferase [Seohaeicola zhoushanensis]GHF55124.1 orotate phosphoribosyltransferase [Seohaeicola zhoushanensis]